MVSSIRDSGSSRCSVWRVRQGYSRGPGPNIERIAESDNEFVTNCGWTASIAWWRYERQQLFRVQASACSPPTDRCSEFKL